MKANKKKRINLQIVSKNINKTKMLINNNNKKSNIKASIQINKTLGQNLKEVNNRKAWIKFIDNKVSVCAVIKNLTIERKYL